MGLKKDIYINIVFEDILSEAVIDRIIAVNRFCVVYTRNLGRGNGYIKKKIRAFNRAARVMHYFVLTDCDNHSCVVELIQDYLPDPVHNNMIFRVAVNEVESWILADREGFAKYMGIDHNLVPMNTDSIPYPKQCLINMARKSRNKHLRTGIVPKDGSTATQGPYYNSCLIPFVQQSWDLDNACKHSNSLLRAVMAIRQI